jgi:hypothetical protein
MSSPPKKPLMRSLGEFVGHIWKGVRQDVKKNRREIDRQVTEEKRGNLTLRETRIREIEIERDDSDERA